MRARLAAPSKRARHRFNERSKAPGFPPARRRLVIMARNRTSRGQLGGIAEMELWLGPFPHLPPAFDSDEQRRELWFRHRDRLMEQFGAHGRRPQAWWRYEAGESRLAVGSRPVMLWSNTHFRFVPKSRQNYTP